MSNLETVQTIYAAFGRGDIPTILAHLDERIEWEHDAEGWEAYGVPWLRPGTGTRHVVGFFEALTALEFLAFTPVSMLANERQVAAVISMEIASKATGARFREYEMHLWTFGEDGKVSRFRHFADTVKHQRAAAR